MTLRACLSRPLVAVLAALSLALTACATEQEQEPAGQNGGPATLTIATSFQIDDLGPLENGFWGPEFGYVELLMRPQRDGTATPWVLESLEPTGDTTWSLMLNEGVEFLNGRPFDASALAQLLTFTAEENAGFAAESSFASAEARGPLEVELTTSAPAPDLPNVLADEANVLVFDVAAYEEHRASGAPASALLEAGLYTGPYAVDALSTDAMELSPVEDHWAGEPALDDLTVRFVAEDTARIQAVQAGEADLALYVPTSAARRLEGRDDAFYVTGKPAGSTFAFQLNHARAPYDDPRVRRAVHLATDYRALAEDVLDGLADVAEGPLPPSLPYAEQTQRTDLDAARGLLEQAGWTGTGIRSKDGRPLTLRLLCYPQQPDSITIATALQAQLAEVGIDVAVTQVEDITEAREQGDWDGAIVGDSLLSFGASPVAGLTELTTGDEDNYQKVSDPQLDRLVAELRTTFDEGRRKQLLRDVQRVLAEGGHFASTVLRRPAVVTNARWRDYEVPISNLWVDRETAPSSG
jgi:peptide/nickel transport system substrate-binding protein